MDAGPSRFGLSLRRTKNDGDDWYIPYKPPSIPHYSQGGIGHSPAPVRSPNPKVFSFFSTSSSVVPPNNFDPEYQFPPTPHRRPYRSPSFSSLSQPQSNPFSIPSSTSVPTGLSGQKMLFSPLHREMRSPPQPIPHTPPHPPPFDGSPRRRVQSTPKPLPSGPQRWAATSACDMLVFPKPHITPITITPPASPPTDDPDVLEMGQLRLREREEWARASQSKVRGRSRSRGRSFSLSHRTEPPPDAPIIGSAVARREEAEHRERRRSSSASRPNLGGRLRSASFGLMSSRRSNSISRPSMERPSLRRNASDRSHTSIRNLSGCIGGRSAVDLGSDRRELFSSLVLIPDPHENVSSPEFFPPHRSEQSRPVRTIRVRSPVRRGEVVIINSKTEPAVDFSKPLPPTPNLDRPPLLDLPSVSSLRQDVGIAISDGSSGSSTPTGTPLHPPTSAVTPVVVKSHSDHTPASARAELAKQHQRAKTRRAFAAPAAGPNRPKSNSSADLISPNALSASRASRASSQSAYSGADRTSIITPTPLYRKSTALDEAIGRSRAASLSQPEGPSSRPGLGERRRTADQPDSLRVPAAVDPIQRTISPPLAYPITTVPSPRFAFESFSQQQDHSLLSVAGPSRPQFSHTDTTASAVSGRTVYTDASEGWDRVGAVTPNQPPSPEDTASPEDDRDFKGLFFRTPQDPPAEFVPKRVLTFKPKRTSVDFPPAIPMETTVGLGYEMPDSSSGDVKRDSSGAFSVDSVIATPTILPDADGGGPQAQPRGTSPSSSRGHGARQVNLGQRRPPSLQHDAEYGLAMRTDMDATSGKRRASVPDASYFRTALSPKTFGVFNTSLDEPTDLDLPSQHADGPISTNQRASQLSALSPHISVGSPLSDRRNSAAVSFINDFPTPPSLQTHNMSHLDIPSGQHASAFGQLVTGPPGAGKTTYCNGMHQFLTALKRPVHIINLDPAVPNPPYPCAINISEIVTLDEAMTEHGLGPNGAMLYCVEYLEKNFDWLVERLDEVLKRDGGGYVIFDTPGQVELWTNHDSLKRIIERLMKMEYRLAAVHLSDAHYITDGSKFISVVLLALRAMMQLEMPHINVLSKIDLLSTYGQLPFDLKYYTEARELGYLLNSLDSGPRSQKMEKLNRAMVELVEEYGLVGFETLAVEDKQSMLQLLRQIDKATGYIFVPPPSSNPGGSSDLLDNAYALFSTGAGNVPGWDVNDVEERWGERKAEWDEVEKGRWQREHESRRARDGGGE